MHRIRLYWLHTNTFNNLIKGQNKSSKQKYWFRPCFLEQMLKNSLKQNILYTCVKLQFHAHFKMPCQHSHKVHQTAEQQFGEILLNKLSNTFTASYLKNNTFCLIALTVKSSPLSCSNTWTQSNTKPIHWSSIFIWAFGHTACFHCFLLYFLLNRQCTQIKPENYAKSLTNQEKSCVALIRSWGINSS